MKIVNHISANVLLPLTMGLLACVVITLVPLNVQKSTWQTMTNTHINNTINSATITRVGFLSKYIETYFNQTNNDLMAAHYYASLLFNNSMSLNRSYNTYYGVSTVDSRTPPKDFTNYYLASSTFKLGTTALVPFLNESYVNTSSIMDNVFRSILKSSSIYDRIYMGFNNGMFRRYPYTLLDTYNTLVYTCVATGLPTIGYDPRCRIWYYLSRDNSPVQYTSPYVDALTGQILITASKQVTINGQLLGVIGADFAMDKIDQIITNSTIMTHGYTFVMDVNGTLVSYPLLNRALANPSVFTSENGISVATWNSVLATKVAAPSPRYITKNGQTWALISQYLPFTGYYLVALYPQSDIDTFSQSFFFTVDNQLLVGDIVLSVIMAAFITAVILITRHYGNVYTKPISDMSDKLDNIRKAKLDIERGERAPASAEFEVLDSCFDNLLVVVSCGNTQYSQGDLNKALISYKRGEDLMRVMMNTRGISVCLNNEGNVYKQLGDFAKAKALYVESIDFARACIPEDKENEAAYQVMIAYRLMNLGVLHKDKNDLKSALEYFTEALDICRRTDNALGISKISGNLGQLQLQMGNIKEAEALIRSTYDQVLVRKEETSIQYAMMNLGLLEAFRHNYEGALSWFSYILQSYEHIDSYVRQVSIDNMYEILTLTGRLVEAAAVRNDVKLPTVRRALDVEFDLDVSGSMSGAPISQCRSSLETIIRQYLGETDLISLITFSSTVTTLFSRLNKRDNLPFIIDRIQRGTIASGGTAFYNALYSSLARAATSHDTSSQWVVALTDGEDNAQSLTAVDVVKQLRKQPINLIIITVGSVSTRNDIKAIITAATTAITKGIFIEIGRNDKEIESAFQKVAKLILGELHVDTL